MIFSTLALSSSAVFAAPTSPLSKSVKVQGYVELECTYSITPPDMTQKYFWSINHIRLASSEKSFEYLYRRLNPPKDNKFSLDGHDLAFAFWSPGVKVDGKAISTWHALSKREDIQSTDNKKIVDWAMLNTNFRMELPKCTKETVMSYGQPIEGELKFRNLQ